MCSQSVLIIFESYQTYEMFINLGIGKHGTRVKRVEAFSQKLRH